MKFEEFYKKALCCVNTRGLTCFDNVIKEEAESVYMSFTRRKENLDDVDVLKRALNAVSNRAYFEINDRLSRHR